MSVHRMVTQTVQTMYVILHNGTKHLESEPVICSTSLDKSSHVRAGEATSPFPPATSLLEGPATGMDSPVGLPCSSRAMIRPWKGHCAVWMRRQLTHKGRLKKNRLSLTFSLSLRGQSLPFGRGARHVHLTGSNSPVKVLSRHFIRALYSCTQCRSVTIATMRDPPRDMWQAAKKNKAQQAMWLNLTHKPTLSPMRLLCHVPPLHKIDGENSN